MRERSSPALLLFYFCPIRVADASNQSRDFATTGGESRVQLDAAASTAAELGLELAPVEFHYSASFDFGKVSLRIVDPAAAETTLHVKAEVYILRGCLAW